jgi:hypothetical protein
MTNAFDVDATVRDIRAVAEYVAEDGRRREYGPLAPQVAARVLSVVDFAPVPRLVRWVLFVEHWRRTHGTRTTARDRAAYAVANRLYPVLRLVEERQEEIRRRFAAA